MKKLILLILAVFTGIAGSLAQEVVSPLRFMPQQKAMVQQRISSVLDTLILPFTDDFSASQVTPDKNLWTDRFVFVNTDMADGPPTLGVATFDGLDEKGDAYDIFSPTGSGLADRLSSQAINLSADDPADSVYLSFFVQPAGFCDPPESNDSLSLEFFASDSLWKRVWSITGSSNRAFQQFMVPVAETQFFHEGFRMRWSSYGNRTGNVDVWHLDYVRLNRNRSAIDTGITDVGFKSRPSSLVTPYQEMPWKQYAADSARFKAANHKVVARNLGAARNVGYKFTTVNRNNNSTVIDVGIQNISPFPENSDFTFNFPSFPIPQTSTDSLELETTYRLQNAPDFWANNDTVRRTQRFWNHFAYDDGTAETGYGLNTIGGSVAYKFYTATPDTLRGLWMYFTQAAENAALELFNLKVWAFIGEGSFTGNESVLTQQPLQRPRYADSIGQFVFYALDTPVLVRDSFYVGWQQLTQRLLNIGLDRNNQVAGVKWFNTLGQWNPSAINGSWMIRPVLATELRFPTSVTNHKEHFWQLYPNPTDGWLRWSGLETVNRVEVKDIQGRLIMQQHDVLVNQVDVSALHPGLYFITLQSQSGRSYTKRFIRH